MGFVEGDGVEEAEGLVVGDASMGDAAGWLAVGSRVEEGSAS